MSFPVEGMTVQPDYAETDGLLGWPMWSGMMVWLVGCDEILDSFASDTEYDFRPLINRTPLEQMIDKATGRERETVLAFFDWATERFWNGDPDAMPELANQDRG